MFFRKSLPLCNAGLVVSYPIAEANRPSVGGSHGRDCASFFVCCASNVYNRLNTLHARHAIKITVQHEDGNINGCFCLIIHNH